MVRIEKTVFISYRRIDGSPWALAVWQYLTRCGFDAFHDIENLGSGDFERAILGNVKDRAHFVILLTPACLERVDNPVDLFRREIETALDCQRNIVPLIFPGFSFSDPATTASLTGKLGLLSKYNGIPVDGIYFNAAMERLTSFLSVPIETVLHPPIPLAAAAAVEQKITAQSLPSVTHEELVSIIWFMRADASRDPKEKIANYTKAIDVRPDFAGAYNNRGRVRLDFLLDIQGAIDDFSRAIELEPGDPGWYLNRGAMYRRLGRFDEALADYGEAIRLKPEYPAAYSNRALIHVTKGDVHLAAMDFDRAIELEPAFENALYERAQLRESQHDYLGAIDDYQRYLVAGLPRRQTDHDQVLVRIRKLEEQIDPPV